MLSASKPRWQQVTALVSLGASGTITGFSFVPASHGELTSPASLPIKLMALERSAQPAASGDAALRAAIVNVARYYLRMAQDKTPAQMEEIIWQHDSIDGVDHGESCAAFASLTLELAAQVVGQQSWVTGGASYPWPLHKWADVRVDPNPSSPGIVSILQDAQAHGRWYPLGDGYRPQPGDWVLFDQHVEVVTKYADGVLDTIGGDSLPNFSVNAHQYPAPLGAQGVVGFVDNGNLAGASAAAAPGSGATQHAAVGAGASSGTAATAAAASSVASSGSAAVPGAEEPAASPAAPAATGRASMQRPTRETATRETGTRETGTRETGTREPETLTGTSRALPGIPGAAMAGPGSPVVAQHAGSPAIPGTAGTLPGGSGSGSRPARATAHGQAQAARRGQTPGQTAGSTAADAEVPGAGPSPATATASTPGAASVPGVAAAAAPEPTAAGPQASRRSPAALPAQAGSAQQAFIDAVAPGAVATQAKYGVPASVTIAQAIDESGWGQSYLATQDRNLFGIKGTGPAGSDSLPTQEYENGQWVTIDAPFRVYHSFSESIDDHGALLATSGYYTQAMAERGDPDAFANALTGVYATNPDYGSDLIQLMQQYHLYRYDAQATGAATAANGYAPDGAHAAHHTGVAAPQAAAIPGVAPAPMQPAPAASRSPAPPHSPADGAAPAPSRAPVHRRPPARATRPTPTGAPPAGPGPAVSAAPPVSPAPPRSVPPRSRHAPGSGPSRAGEAAQRPTRPLESDLALGPGTGRSEADDQSARLLSATTSSARTAAADPAPRLTAAEHITTAIHPAPRLATAEQLTAATPRTAARAAAKPYLQRMPTSVNSAFALKAKPALMRSQLIYRDVASYVGIGWQLLAACDWMQCEARPRYSPVHGEKLGTVNPDGTVYRTRSEALEQCASDLADLARAVYGIDLTAAARLSVGELAKVFAAFRWGGLLKLHHTSAMEFPYAVAGLTADHLSMRWPAIGVPDAPDKPGSRFRGPFGAVPLVLRLNYPATE
jgi:flagellum-specific peptidoglycan hydrolase FlgJ